MNKIVRLIQNYLLLGFPFVILCVVWETIQPDVAGVIWTGLAFNLMFWFFILILFLFMLVLMPSVREKTIRRLAHIQERDEREEYITGKAARATYISTLSLMILCLFLSIFTLQITRALNPTAGHKHKINVHIGLNFSLLDEKPPINSSALEEVIFDFEGLPLSKPALILIFLSWQILVFNYVARKNH